MDWAGLPVDNPIEFVVRLRLRLRLLDWLRFGAVCKAWKRAAETALSDRLRGACFREALI